MEDPKEKYEKLKVQLVDGFEWPSLYMFKFIIPADNEKLARVEGLFTTKESQVDVKQSRTGKYLSITAQEIMVSPQSVIDRYLEAEEIGGVIAL